MASLYKRSSSPFWWIEFQKSGQRKQVSTKLRHDITGDTRKARELCREVSAQEISAESAGAEAWEQWAIPYMRERYSNSPATLRRFETAWRNISAFLQAEEIVTPRQLTRQHVRAYVRWRQERHAALGCYEVCKNSALTEIKFLRIVMREAVQNGFAVVNPCDSLGIPLDVPPKKPRITAAEHEKIWKALEKEPDWMRLSYIIAWEQGCRFSETHLHLPTQVDLAREIIRFRTKGHKSSLAEFPMSPRLAPIFRQLLNEGRTWSYDMPLMPGKAWWRFFRRNKLSHLCFHCTRVTFITRCYEKGIPREGVMRLAGHSTYAAHSVYPRLTADDSAAKALRAQLA